MLVDSIYVELLRKEAKQSDKLKSLLIKLVNLTKVELALGRKTISGVAYDSIGNTVAPALLRLSGIADLTLKNRNASSPYISFVMLNR